MFWERMQPLTLREALIEEQASQKDLRCLSDVSSLRHASHIQASQKPLICLSGAFEMSPQP